MNITWYGQSCFKVESKDVSLMIDPYDAKHTGLKTIRPSADIVLSTHDHDSHNRVDIVRDSTLVVKTAGEYECKEVIVRGFQTYHDNKQGKDNGINIIYVIEAEDMTICHLGDLGHPLSKELVGKIGDVDMLMVPVGNSSTIGTKEAMQIVNDIEPKIVIPMHYKVKGLKMNLETVDKFAKELGGSPKDAIPKLNIRKKNLPVDDTDLVILDPA